MLSTSKLPELLSYYISYSFIGIAALTFLLWLFYEWNELSAKMECNKRNLKYIRTPSQSLAVTRKKTIRPN